MAYNGTTAGATAANPPLLLAGAIGGKVLNNGSTLGGTAAGMGANFWMYTSTDSSTAPFTANYFTDALPLGMRAGDVVMQVGATGSTLGISFAVIGAVSTAGAAYASSGAQISSTFG